MSMLSGLILAPHARLSVTILVPLSAPSPSRARSLWLGTRSSVQVVCKLVNQPSTSDQRTTTTSLNTVSIPSTAQVCTHQVTTSNLIDEPPSTIAASPRVQTTVPTTLVRLAASTRVHNQLTTCDLIGLGRRTTCSYVCVCDPRAALCVVLLLACAASHLQATYIVPR
jgi:hypothetical protein